MWRVLVFAQKHQSLLTYGSKKQIIIIVKILNSEHEYSSPCHPQNQVKVLPKRRRSEHDPEHVSLLLATTHFHWLRQSMRQIKIYNPFWKENMDAASSGLKKSGTIQLVISTQFKSLHLWRYAGAYRICNLHTWKRTVNAERYIWVLDQQMVQASSEWDDLTY